MINLKKCTVLVNNKAEYIALIKEAQKQGFTWATGRDLTEILCNFPTRLRFNELYAVRYGSYADYYERDYQCKDIISKLRILILKRKEGCYVKREVIY